MSQIHEPERDPLDALGQVVAHCTIIDSAFHDVDPERRLIPPVGDPISIGENVWLGVRVIVLPGVTIGNDCVVGIGSIVTTDVRHGASLSAYRPG